VCGPYKFQMLLCMTIHQISTTDVQIQITPSGSRKKKIARPETPEMTHKIPMLNLTFVSRKATSMFSKTSCYTQLEAAKNTHIEATDKLTCCAPSPRLQPPH